MNEERVPWHHNIVAVLALIFYAIAVLTHMLFWLGLGAVLNLLNPDFLTLLRGLPGWLELFWTLSAWAGLIGAWLLYIRNHLAPALLFVAFVAFCVIGFWATFFTSPSLLGIFGLVGLYLLLGTGAISMLFYLYSRWERTQAILEW